MYDLPETNKELGIFAGKVRGGSMAAHPNMGASLANSREQRFGSVKEPERATFGTFNQPSIEQIYKAKQANNYDYGADKADRSVDYDDDKGLL